MIVGWLFLDAPCHFCIIVSLVFLFVEVASKLLLSCWLILGWPLLCCFTSYLAAQLTSLPSRVGNGPCHRSNGAVQEQSKCAECCCHHCHCNHHHLCITVGFLPTKPLTHEHNSYIVKIAAAAAAPTTARAASQPTSNNTQHATKTMTATRIMKQRLYCLCMPIRCTYVLLVKVDFQR